MLPDHYGYLSLFCVTAGSAYIYVCILISTAGQACICMLLQVVLKVMANEMTHEEFLANSGCHAWSFKSGCLFCFVFCTGSSQRRHSSMARIHSMTIEAPITKVMHHNWCSWCQTIIPFWEYTWICFWNTVAETLSTASGLSRSARCNDCRSLPLHHWPLHHSPLHHFFPRYCSEWLGGSMKW